MDVKLFGLLGLKISTQKIVLCAIMRYGQELARHLIYVYIDASSSKSLLNFKVHSEGF